MKTIELISGSQKAQFTTKSVTFNGKEFFYANMSDVADHADDCFYTFTYDGELHTLPYEKKDAKILNAIFSQVQNMKSAKKQEPAEQPEPAPEKPAEEQPAGDVQEQPEETAEEQPAETTEEQPAETAEPAQPAEENADGRESAESQEPEESQESEEPEDPEKKRKLKKSLIVFAIVVGVIAVLALVYFLVFGTHDEPSPINPSTDASQTYQDIDEVIEDMQ